MSYIEKIKIELSRTGLLEGRPGDALTITYDDIETYRRVEAVISFLDEAFRPLRKTAKEEK